MNPPTLTFMTNADDQRSRKTERLGEVLRRVAARLATQRNSGSAFNGSSQNGEWDAAAGTYTPTAAGKRVNHQGEEGTVARQCGMKTADHFAPPSSAATAASNFARQSASCS